MSDQPTCEERIGEHMESAMDDLRNAQFQQAYECDHCGHTWGSNDIEDECPSCGEIAEFYGQDDARDRYMEGVLEITPLHNVYRVGLSWGGPADGFLLYVDPLDKTIEYVVYYYSDWFDHAERRLSEDEAELVKGMFESYIQLE